MNNIIGVDIGTHGALALIDATTGALLDVQDMPILDEPIDCPAVNGPRLADLAFLWQARHALIELMGARPGEGAVGAFAFGRSRGIVEGVLAACGVTPIAPASWIRLVGFPTGRQRAKDSAISEAVRCWPTKASLFARVKDDGRAEAALIAAAGLIKLARNA